MSSSSSTHITSLILLSVVLMANVRPAMMLPPPMLRTVCGAFADAEEVMGNKAMAAGKAAVDLAMKPIAVVGGLKAAAVGAGMKVSGGAIRFVGEKMAKDGTYLESAGAGVKGAGLGVAALGVKPLAEKVVEAGTKAEGSINAASAAATSFAKSIGDTSIQIDATIDSPIVGHHHKEVSMTAGLETALNNPLLSKGQQQQHSDSKGQQQQEIQQRADTVKESHSVAKRAAKIDTDVLKSALNLVKEAKMSDCVLRAICDLNCDPQGFGPDGKQVFMNMVRLQGAKVLEESESKTYHEAAAKGRSYTGKCQSCTTHYDKCNSKSSDLIKMASHIRMD